MYSIFSGWAARPVKKHKMEGQCQLWRPICLANATIVKMPPICWGCCFSKHGSSQDHFLAAGILCSMNCMFWEFASLCWDYSFGRTKMKSVPKRGGRLLSKFNVLNISSYLLGSLPNGIKVSWSRRPLSSPFTSFVHWWYPPRKFFGCCSYVSRLIIKQNLNFVGSASSCKLLGKINHNAVWVCTHWRRRLFSKVNILKIHFVFVGYLFTNFDALCVGNHLLGLPVWSTNKYEGWLRLPGWFV